MAAFGEETNSNLWLNMHQENSQKPGDFAKNNLFTSLADPNNINNPFLRQRLELLWSQALQYQQNKTLSSTENNDTQKNHNFQDGKAQEVMQKLLANQANSTSASNHIPWPSLATLASNTQLKNNASTYLNTQRISGINQELGNLLPPPPLLSISPEQHAISTVNATTSKPNAIDLTLSVTSHNNKDAEKNQPLDLTTSNKRPSSQEQIDNISKPVMHSTPLKQPESLNNNNFQPFSNVFAPFQQSLANQSALSSLTPQQLTALAPFLQNSAAASRLPSSMYNQNMMQPLSPEYLQKWIQMAQSRQQLQQQVRMQQPQRKRQKLSEYNGISNVNHRASFNSMNIPQNDKFHFVNNNQRSVTSQNRNKPNVSPNSQTASQQQNSSGKRYKRYAKPPYSYVSLITLSILSSPEKKLRLSQILKRISEMFPFFNGSYQGWRDSVRHNLSQNECFVKVLKNPFRPTAKGNYWTVNITTIPHELLLRQNTLVSRYAQDSGYRYRKDLTEVFDLMNGQVKINIPRHLFNGVRLIEDPAAVMEALLLEEKLDDNCVMTQGPDNIGTISLHDMFNQDDFIEEDMLRQHQSGNVGNRWNKSKSRAQQQAAQDKFATPTLTTQPNVLSNPYYHQYVNNLAPQTLAMQMLQQTQSNPINTNSELQNNLISRALALQTSVVNSLPVLQNYYSQTNGIKVETDNEVERSVATTNSTFSLAQKSPQEVVDITTELKTEEHCDEGDVNGSWEQLEKRSRRKGIHPIRRQLSGEGSNQVKLERDTPISPPTSAVDSGIVGSLSPHSPTRSFSSSEEQELSSNLAIDQSSPVRSRSSDVSTTDTVTSEEILSPASKFVMPFSIFNNALPLETSKLA